MAIFMYNFVEKLNVAAKMDEDLNRAMKPAIEKLKMLPEVWNVLHKHPLQIKFLDCGGLSSFVNWLVPLPDGSLPNTNVRTTVLTLLADFPIDVASNQRREQLKSSGIGKIVMALTRLPHETPANQKLARDLVNKWSRPLFDNSISYDNIRRPYRAEPPQPPQPQSMATKKAPVKRTIADRGDDLDVHQGSKKKLKQAEGCRIQVEKNTGNGRASTNMVM
ncbi:hypothetical protein KC19_2G196300 [Ceratodon purpureus]|uniref:TFIIS N-terminal domain-containing protein n=1 Tax=Ceratodon purpureus TaxID=3225 RepID=A0A8T0IZR8_CERPU|nr:hypothetical protein KC19_2G196300 [Ceratodon purpureus]